MTFEQADAQTHPFPNWAFGIAISRHGAMFFGDARAAFTNIAHALRLGGRLVLLTWQPFEQNEFMRAFSTALAAGHDIPLRTWRVVATGSLMLGRRSKKATPS